jgi:hypothetical protein
MEIQMINNTNPYKILFKEDVNTSQLNNTTKIVSLNVNQLDQLADFVPNDPAYTHAWIFTYETVSLIENEDDSQQFDTLLELKKALLSLLDAHEAKYLMLDFE